MANSAHTLVSIISMYVNRTANGNYPHKLLNLADILQNGQFYWIRKASSLVKIPTPRVRYLYPTWTLMVDCYNLTHVIVPRLPGEGCTLFVLELTRMVVK